MEFNVSPADADAILVNELRWGSLGLLDAADPAAGLDAVGRADCRTSAAAVVGQMIDARTRLLLCRRSTTPNNPPTPGSSTSSGTSVSVVEWRHA
jgi:hypothetical protein